MHVCVFIYTHYTYTQYIYIYIYILCKKYILDAINHDESLLIKNIYIYTYSIYTVGTENIQTPLNFSLFVILQPFAKII